METLVPQSRKQQIEDQATALFRARGYAASSMRDLAAVLGIEAASLYSHISSKEEILQTICFRMADAFFQAIEKLEEPSPDLRLAVAIRAHLKVITRNVDASAVFLNEWRHLSEPSLSEFLTLRDQYEQIFVEIIDQGIQMDLFRPVDRKLAMMTILSSINWTHQWYNPNGKMTIDEIADQLSGMLINGIINNHKT